MHPQIENTYQSGQRRQWGIPPQLNVLLGMRGVLQPTSVPSAFFRDGSKEEHGASASEPMLLKAA